MVLRAPKGMAGARVALVGLGKSTDFGDKAFNEVATAAVRGCGAGVATLALAIGDWKVAGRGADDNARALVAAARATAFRSDALKSKEAQAAAPAPRLRRITLITDKPDRAVDAGLRQGGAIANGVELAKRLGNLPANVCTPDYLAGQARALAREWGLKAQIMDRRRIAALGMGSFLSVTNGSVQPPRLIVLRYEGAGRRGFADPVALVGKGITFDSGGISLKPGAAMDEMKYDMCGAAAVLGTMRAVAELKLRINVIGVIPACENLPSGSATKPGDIVTSMSGQTIEVLNTDAEGRLILCDALTYVERFKPAAIIDVATLTGACIVALGNVHSGLFSKDDALAAELLAAARPLRRHRLAPADRRRVPGPAQVQLRRHGQHRAAGQRRLGHGGLLPGALRQGPALGAPGHRRHRLAQRRGQGCHRATGAAADAIPAPARSLKRRGRSCHGAAASVRSGTGDAARPAPAIDFHFNVDHRINYACRVRAQGAQRRHARCSCISRDDARRARLDMALWTFSALDFLPHVALPSPLAAQTPIWLSSAPATAARDLLLLLDDAAPPDFAQWFPESSRVIDLVPTEADDRVRARAAVQGLSRRRIRAGCP